jgi:ubiquitin carboxyl-terminal hydrolase 7
LNSYQGQQVPIPLNEAPLYGPSLSSRTLEVIEKGSYEWVITSWKQISQREQNDSMDEPVKAYSPEFVIANRKWRLLLFPIGNNSENVSIYLDYADKKEPNSGWSCCARFVLSIVNAYDSSVMVTQQAQHRFDEREPDWGFNQFMPLRDLTQSMPPAKRPLLENDSCKITVDIEVIKDTTGHLWARHYKFHLVTLVTTQKRKLDSLD